MYKKLHRSTNENIINQCVLDRFGGVWLIENVSKDAGLLIGGVS